MKLLHICAAALVASLSMVSGASAQPKDWSSIKIATEGAYKPWNFTDPSGKLIGFEIDLAEDLCKRMKAKCEIVAQAFDGVIPALNAGKFDAIMAGMNITDKRKEAIAFTQPYGRTPSTFAVLKSNALAKLPEAGKVYSLNADGLAAAREVDQRAQADAQGQGHRRADVDGAGEFSREVFQGRDRNPPVQDDRAARSRSRCRPRRRRCSRRFPTSRAWSRRRRTRK